MCFKCCLTFSLCFMYSPRLMTQSLSTLRQQQQVSAVHLWMPVSVSGWHCHTLQPRLNTFPLCTGRYATAKDKQRWPMIWLSYPMSCTHPLEGHRHHGAEADMVHSSCQCHLTFCLAVSVGRCCSCCYKAWQLSLWQGESSKMSEWVASSPKMPQILLCIMMCI